jgi:predicted nucleotidyltransferase
MFKMPDGFDIIASFLTGSHLYGTNTPESDVDLRGVFVPPESYFLGFLQNVKQFEDNENDIVFYDLRKFLKLAANNNPNILEMLYIPQTMLKQTSPMWNRIIENRHLFAAKTSYKTFMGYAHAQIKRIERHYGKEPNPDRNPKRAELEEKFGYDTKHAMHVFRLGYECEELFTTGEIKFPLQYATHLLQIKNGLYTFDEVKEKFLEMEERLKELKEKSSLPEKANFKAIDELCIKCMKVKFFNDFFLRSMKNGMTLYEGVNFETE